MRREGVVEELEGGVLCYNCRELTARTTTTIIFLSLHYTPAQTVASVKLLLSSFPKYPSPDRRFREYYESTPVEFVFLNTTVSVLWNMEMYEVEWEEGENKVLVGMESMSEVSPASKVNDEMVKKRETKTW